MKLVSILKVVEERTGNRKLEGLTDLRELIKDNWVAVEKMEIAERISNEALRKCSLKLKSVPKVNVKLQRLTPDKIKALMEELAVEVVEEVATSCILCHAKLDGVNLEGHLSSCVVYKEKGDSCQMCGQSLSNYTKVRVHYREVHLKIRNHPCDICDLRLKTSGELNSHRMDVHFPGRRQYTCRKCKVTLNSRWKIMQHRRSCYEKEKGENILPKTEIKEEDEVPEIEAIIYPEDVKHATPIDDKTGATMAPDQKKTNEENLKFKGNQCPKCKKIYSSNNYAWKHYEAVHLKLRRFQCQTCSVKFGSKHSLHNHEILGICQRKEATSTKDKQFKCDKCPQSFAERCYLTRHIRRLHQNVLRHTCKTCDAKFFEKSKLNRHIRTVHLKERKYLCDLCPETFKQKLCLSVHKAKAHSAQSFKCEEPCNKEFPVKRSLLLHQKKCAVFKSVQKPPEDDPTPIADNDKVEETDHAFQKDSVSSTVSTTTANPSLEFILPD